MNALYGWSGRSNTERLCTSIKMRSLQRTKRAALFIALVLIAGPHLSVLAGRPHRARTASKNYGNNEPSYGFQSDRDPTPANPLYTRLAPGCVEWFLDPYDLVLQTSVEHGGRIQLLNYGIQVNQRDGSFIIADQHGGIGLGYGGLNLGECFVLDFSLKPRFEVASREPTGMHYLLSGGGVPPKWNFGVSDDLNVTLERLGVTQEVAYLSTFSPSAAAASAADATATTSAPSDWQQLLIASCDGVTALYLNGTKISLWRQAMLEAATMLGNSPVAEMKGPWGGWIKDVKFCLGSNVNRIMAQERLARDDVHHHLSMMNRRDADWAEPLRGKRVVLVGNSNKLMGTGMGFLIDHYDAIFRFNALPLTNADDCGTVTTHEVLSDLTELCGCIQGQCCTPYQLMPLKELRAPKGRALTFIYASGVSNMPASLNALAGRHTYLTQASLNRHMAQILNGFLDHQARRHPMLARSHRVWGGYGFRAGPRILLTLLAHGVVQPSIIGFDLDRETNALYSGRSSHQGDDYKHLIETMVLNEMVQAGLVINLDTQEGQAGAITAAANQLLAANVAANAAVAAAQRMPGAGPAGLPSATTPVWGPGGFIAIPAATQAAQPSSSWGATVAVGTGPLAGPLREDPGENAGEYADDTSVLPVETELAPVTAPEDLSSSTLLAGSMGELGESDGGASGPIGSVGDVQGEAGRASDAVSVPDDSGGASASSIVSAGDGSADASDALAATALDLAAPQPALVGQDVPGGGVGGSLQPEELATPTLSDAVAMPEVIVEAVAAVAAGNGGDPGGTDTVTGTDSGGLPDAAGDASVPVGTVPDVSSVPNGSQ